MRGVFKGGGISPFDLWGPGRELKPYSWSMGSTGSAEGSLGRHGMVRVALAGKGS